MCSVTLSCRRPSASATLYGPASTEEARSVLGVNALTKQSWGLYSGHNGGKVLRAGRYLADRADEAPDGRWPAASVDEGSTRESRPAGWVSGCAGGPPFCAGRSAAPQPGRPGPGSPASAPARPPP